MTVVTFLPFPPDLHLPSGVLLQSQIFKVPDSRNYVSTLCSIRRNEKDAVYSCIYFTPILGQKFAGASGQVFSLEVN